MKSGSSRGYHDMTRLLIHGRGVLIYIIRIISPNFSSRNGTITRIGHFNVHVVSAYYVSCS
jgi:hypothetical protein